ncbi:MAG: hypothetical protein WAV05_06175, partial [Anaerolineales bacterium]
MKTHFWGIVIFATVFFLSAAMLDWPGLIKVKEGNVKSTIVLAETKQVVLRSCDSSQGNSIGPLVPDQKPSSSEKTLSELKVSEGIPKAAWSARAGFSIASPTDPVYWAGMLGSGWYLDWGMQSDAQLDRLEHWQMVRVHQDCISPSPEDIRSTATSYPGQVWIIGNEPDVIWQDNVTAPTYAATYHELYVLIKSSDPTALIAVGGVAQATPLRLQYLDQVLQSYQDLYHQPMPADWWTVHGYVLREQKGSWGVDIPPGINVKQGKLYEVRDHDSIELFTSQLISFRQWMAGHGYQHTPLALTEFGILMPTSYGFPTESIANYLVQTFSWLYHAQDETIGYPEDGYHLVQKWAWFSISDPTYSSSD